MKGNSTDYLRQLSSMYELRINNRVFNLPKPKRNALKLSFALRGAEAWNSNEDRRKYPLHA